MKKELCLSIVLLGLFSAATVFAGAGANGGQGITAPEIDPGSAISACTLLAGALAVMRGRRSKS
jgi:hypothetical protein